MQLNYVASPLRILEPSVITMNYVIIRRTVRDDGKGVDEPLGEVVCLDGSCKGLTVHIQ